MQGSNPKHSMYPMGTGVMYHVSPRKNREKILSQGLQGHLRQTGPWHDADKPNIDTTWNYSVPQPAGNYLFDNPDDAFEYTHVLNSRQRKLDQYGDPVEPAWEDQFTHTYPHDFNDWEGDKQDQWYEENEPVERTDDPNGYDIYAVNAHGLPLAPDPETRLHYGPQDLGVVHDKYKQLETDMGWKENWFDTTPDDLHRAVGDYYGMEPRRYYIPQGVDPTRLQLHQHVPAWDLTHNTWEDSHDESNRVPTPWMQVPMTEWPQPGHDQRLSSWTAGITHEPGQWGRGVVTPQGQVHTWPEDLASHYQYIHSVLGDWDMSPYDKFMVQPDGTPIQVSDPSHKPLVEEALHVSSSMPWDFSPLSYTGDENLTELDIRTAAAHHPKHHTTLSDHERGKARYGLPKPHKTRKLVLFPKRRKKGAADPQWLQQWIKTNGPWLYHSCDPRVRDKILKEGLIPHDLGPGSVYSGALVPRENAVYVRAIPQSPMHGRSDYAHVLKNRVAIDLRKLDPNRIQADEDAWGNGETVHRDLGIPRTYERYPGGNMALGQVIEDSEGNQFPNWGAWADHWQLNQPGHTAHSLNHLHTASIFGGVSPDALMPAEHVHLGELSPPMIKQAQPAPEPEQVYAAPQYPKRKVPCNRCDGLGMVMQDDWGDQWSRSCPECRGDGYLVNALTAKTGGWGDFDEISPVEVTDIYRPYRDDPIDGYGRDPNPLEPIPATMYHKAPGWHRNLIEQYGLLPDPSSVGGERTHEWAEPGVYMTTSPTNAWGSGGTNYWQVNTTKLDHQHFKQDPNISNAWYYTQPIPPEAITYNPHPPTMVEDYKQRNPQHNLRPVLGAWHFSDKLHDFLMNPKSRPDLQTPEGQAFLQTLEGRYWNEKTDALMPWLAKEWKKGRILHRPETSAIGYEDHDDEDHPRRVLTPQTLDHWADFLGSNHPMRRDFGDLMKSQVSFTPTWKHHHTGEIYTGMRDHPNDERLPDPDVPHFPSVVNSWDEAMRQQARQEALGKGDVVHQHPDGWSLQQLTSPEALKAEGDAMGHCVGGYGDAVEKGRSMIYSLRDHNNVPHATMEIQPTEYEQTEPFDIRRTIENHSVLHRAPEEVKQALQDYDQWSAGGYEAPQPESVTNFQGDIGELHDNLVNSHEGRQERERGRRAKPHNGQVIQIKGKGNAEPLPEYKARLKDWFKTFPPETRPNGNSEDWESLYDDEGYVHNSLDEPSLIPAYEEEFGRLQKPPVGGVEDEYGLLTRAQPMEADYDDLLKNIGINHHGHYPTHNGQHVEDIYRLALARGEIPQLSQAAQSYDEHANEMFQEWEDMNYDHFPRYPDASEPDGYHDEEANEVEEGQGRPYWKVQPSSYQPEVHYDPAAAEMEYNQEMAELYRQHPETQAASQLYGLLNQHVQTPEGRGNDLKAQPQEQVWDAIGQRWDDEDWKTALSGHQQFSNGESKPQGFGHGQNVMDALDRKERESKTAQSSSVMYHVAPSSARESIMQHGIDHTKGQSGTDYITVGNEPGNYLWANHDDALYSKETHEENLGEPWDVWEVRGDGLALQHDPYWEQNPDTVEPMAQAYYVREPIDPQRIHCVTAQNPGSRANYRLAAPIGQEYWEHSPKWQKLYHGTTAERAQQILQEGLRPWDDVGFTPYEYSLWQRPRPGHVYLSYDRPSAMSAAHRAGANPVLLEIDPHRLDPMMINPDEDNNRRNRYTPGLSKGDLAEAQGFGDDAQETEDVLERKNTHAVAHRGPIAASAITAVHMPVVDDGRPGYVTMPVDQYMASNPRTTAYQPPSPHAHYAQPSLTQHQTNRDHASNALHQEERTRHADVPALSSPHPVDYLLGPDRYAAWQSDEDSHDTDHTHSPHYPFLLDSADIEDSAHYNGGIGHQLAHAYSDDTQQAQLQPKHGVGNDMMDTHNPHLSPSLDHCDNEGTAQLWAGAASLLDTKDTAGSPRPQSTDHSSWMDSDRSYVQASTSSTAAWTEQQALCGTAEGAMSEGPKGIPFLYSTDRGTHNRGEGIFDSKRVPFLGSRLAGDSFDPNQEWYHVAPADDRSSVLERGIDWRRRDQSRDWRMDEDYELYPSANYISNNYDKAKEYAKDSGGDIWTVDPQGLDLTQDVDEDWGGSAFYTKDPIHPSRIRLHTPWRSEGYQ